MFSYTKANVKHTCIDAEAKAMLHDGSRKLVRDLEIGDRVKTLNANGELVDTDVIMMMDISQQECRFHQGRFIFMS